MILIEEYLKECRLQTSKGGCPLRPVYGLAMCKYGEGCKECYYKTNNIKEFVEHLIQYYRRKKLEKLLS